MKNRKSKKILLISPLTRKDMAESLLTAPPMGIVRLSAFLALKGHEAEYFDINLHMLTGKGPIFEEKIKEKNWDIIGFSTLDRTLSADIGNMYTAKRLCPNSIIVAGGMGSQFDYQTILDKSPCRIVVLGEGEIPMLMLADGAPLGEIPGIIFRNDAIPLDQKTFCEATNVIKWEDIQYEKYWDFYLEKYGDKRNEQAEKQIHTVRVFSKNRCPFRCNYCSSTNQLTLASGGKPVPIVGLEENNIIDIIERIVKSHPRVRTIYFTDDDFCVNEKRVIDLCKKIIEKKFKVSFMCLTRISDLNEDIIRWLVKANFRNLNIGVESFSQKVLEEINKRCGQDLIHANLALLKKHNLSAFLNIILITPKCNIDDVEETVDQATHYIKDGFFAAGINLACEPLKGSVFRELSTNFMTDLEQIPGTKFFLKRDKLIYAQDPYVREVQMFYYNHIDEEVDRRVKKQHVVHTSAANLAMIKLEFMKGVIVDIRKKYNLPRQKT